MQIFKLFFKDKKGAKVEYDIGANAENVKEDSSHRFITDVERQQWNAKIEEKDLGAAAKYAVANNDTTTAPGFLADARVVKQHGDEIDQLNSDLDGNRFGHTADGRPGWKDGADTVHPFISEVAFGGTVTGQALYTVPEDGFYVISTVNKSFGIKNEITVDDIIKTVPLVFSDPSTRSQYTAGLFYLTQGQVIKIYNSNSLSVVQYLSV